MDLQHVQKVKDWVELDNKILRNREDLKEVVEKKKVLEEDIITYVKNNNIENFSLNISDGHIKFAKRTTNQPLSIKVMRLLLEKFNEERNASLDVADICQFVSDNLEKSSTLFMKRDIK